MTGFFTTIWIISGIVWGLFCWALAKRRNRGTGNWASAGFIFGIIAFILLACLPTLKEKEEE